MEIHQISQKPGTSLLNKIIFIIFGIFITSLIFAFFINYFSTSGIWIGLVFSLAVTAIIFYFFEKGARARLIAWGMLGTITICTILFLAGLNILSDILNKVV